MARFPLQFLLLLFAGWVNRRLAVKGKTLGRKLLDELNSIVTPDTILRWYRKLVANKYDGSNKRSPGRPRTRQQTTELVLLMARDNPRWGYTRTRGALHNLGIELGRTTIKRILFDSGIEPAPERGKRMPWKTFLKAHWGHIVLAAKVDALEPAHRVDAR